MNKIDDIQKKMGLSRSPITSLIEVIYKFTEIDHKASNFGTDKPLFHSEIHLITAIKIYEGIHITGLAEILGVTKGAVSQILIKLDKKGLIQKEIDPQNKSKFLLKLTPKGEIAYQNHLNFHQKIEDLLKQILADKSKEKIQFLQNFLTDLREKLETFNYN